MLFIQLCSDLAPMHACHSAGRAASSSIAVSSLPRDCYYVQQHTHSACLILLSSSSARMNQRGRAASPAAADQVCEQISHPAVAYLQGWARVHVAHCRHCGCSSDFSCGGKKPWGFVAQPSRLYYQAMPAKVPSDPTMGEALS